VSQLDDLRAVIELACLTEDRSNDEQKALLRLAVKCDREANRLTATNNRTGEAWRLHRLVEGTRELIDDQKPVVLKADVRAKLDQKADNWDRFHEAFQRGEWTPEMAEAGA
jgi:hypothetical protein